MTGVQTCALPISRGGDVERDVKVDEFVRRVLAEVADGMNGGD